MPVKQQNQNGKYSMARSSHSSREKTDWKKVDALSDAAIRKAVRNDPDAAPLLDPSWFRRAKIVLPEPKKAVSIRLDSDVMAWMPGPERGFSISHFEGKVAADKGPIVLRCAKHDDCVLALHLVKHMTGGDQ